MEVMSDLARFPFEVFDRREGLLLIPGGQVNFNVLF